MKHTIIKYSLFLSLLVSASANSFELSSSDIGTGKHMSKSQEFEGFGCSGENSSPQLSWSNPPKDTKAFAILAYDPDAPTGSGWWHWQVVNIPSSVDNLTTDAGNLSKKLAPEGSFQVVNDYGIRGFGGACPPKGHGVHRYQFTIYALSKKLEIPEGASGALTGYMVKSNSLASDTIEALYKRD